MRGKRQSVDLPLWVRWGRWVAWTLVFVAGAGFVTTCLWTDAYGAGLNPIGFFALGITVVALCVSLQIFAVQNRQGVEQEERYNALFEEIGDAAQRAATNAAGAQEKSAAANEAVARLELIFARAARERGREYSEDQQRETARVYSQLRSASAELVLWVDDQADMIEWERKALAEAGVRSVWVSTTDDALALLEGNDFGAVVTDMGRREGPREGYVLLDAMRGSGDTTPVYVYSTSRERKHIEEVIEHGGQGCTNDPFEIVDLISKALLGGASAVDGHQ